MHGAEHRPAEMLEPDQRPPHRQAGDEGARPVDRIEHPDVLGVLALAAEFLAEDAVLGKSLGEQPAHRLLRRPIGHRDRIEGAVAELVLDVEALTEPRKDRPTRDLRHLVEEGGEILTASDIGHWTSLRRSADRRLGALPGAAAQVRPTANPTRRTERTADTHFCGAPS